MTLAGACGASNPGVVGEAWELLGRLTYRQRYALYKCVLVGVWCVCACVSNPLS